MQISKRLPRTLQKPLDITPGDDAGARYRPSEAGEVSREADGMRPREDLDRARGDA